MSRRALVTFLSAFAIAAGLIAATPVALAPAASATTVSSPPVSTGAAGWGYNDYNQANGIGESVPGPVRVGPGDIPTDATVTGVYASGGNTACLVASGKAYCWGTGGYGSLGNNSTDDTPLPRAVDDTGVLAGKTIVDMAVSLRTACALTQDNLIACWGTDHGGSLGDGGANTDTEYPVLADQSGDLSGRTVVSIVASYQNFCALDSLGNAYCWGDGARGLNGDGTNSNHSVPTLIDMTPLGADTFESLGDGVQTLCGVSTAHEAYCWGQNSEGQIGDGTRGFANDRNRPTKVLQNAALGADVVHISGGWSFTCAARATAGAACWGYGPNGELGNGLSTSSDVPVAVSEFAGRAGRPITDVVAADSSACAIVDNTDTYCWGYAGYGALGTGNYLPEYLPAPDLPVLDSPAGLNGAHLTSLAAMDNAPCGVGDDGHAYCWGWNSSPGYAGVGSSTTAPYATMLYGGFLADGETFTEVETGVYIGCGMTSLGRMWCWGGNDYGEHGQGNNDSDMAASLIGGILSGKTLIDVAVGAQHVCGLASDGTLACWGSGSVGAIGDGSRTDLFVPTAPDLSVMPAGRKIISVSAAEESTCALDDAGAAYCWGANGYGQLGVGDQNDKYVPTAVDTSGVLAGKVLTALVIDYESTCAVDTAGAGYCWGRDQSGSLGNGLAVDQSVPTSIDMSTMPVGATWTQLDPGESQTCGIAAGVAYCWGTNGSGQLGTGDSTDQPLPYPVDTTGSLSGKTITDLAIGYYTSCALDSEGVVYCWGDGSQGQNGSGTYDQTYSPNPIVTEGTTVEGLRFSSIEAAGENYTVVGVLAPTNAVPGEPTNVQVAVRSNARALVSWQEPADTGGSDISDYVVEYATSGTGPWTTPTGCASVGAALSCTVTGLNVTRNYVFRVSAVNDTGQGPSVRAWLRRTPSVVIAGHRSEKAAKAIIIDGTSVGLTSKSVTIRVKLRGQSGYTSYEAGRVDVAGRFAWRGEAARKAFVVAVIDGVRSNRVTIA